MSYSISHINRIVDGSLKRFTRDDTIEHLLTDSRRLIFPASTLFFALPAARRDGHQFITDLYQRGVRNFVISHEIDHQSFPDANIIFVKDSLVGLQKLASFHRGQFDIPVIGITGSNGKTVVKEWLNQMLEDRFKIVRSPRSYNSQIGVPLSVWQMKPADELGIFEAGISAPNEMQRLERIVRPSIGVFTTLTEAHGENFSGNLEKAVEKLRLFHSSTTVIYPADIGEIRQALNGLPELQLIGWGWTHFAAVRLDAIDIREGQSKVRFAYRENDYSLDIPFTDRASIENAITCVCVLLYFNIAEADIQLRLQSLVAIAMRLELKQGINHCSIINDSYSADISSLNIALHFMTQQRQHRKRTVILSDILQSNLHGTDLYTAVASSLKQRSIGRLIGIGPDISANHTLFAECGITDALYYPSTESFLHALPNLIFRDELILIKGARVFEFEKIEHLLTEQIHQTVLEVNLDAVAHNLRHYQQLLKPATRIMAMVKAFAYGSGMYEIANLLQFHKVDYLAVAYADEGVSLRKAGINIPIMVMNTEKSGYEAIVQHHLEPVLYSENILDSFGNFVKKEGLQYYPVHVEINTGMNRLGFSAGKIDDLIGALKVFPFNIRSVFSHLAASEEAQQDNFTAQQAKLFNTAVDKMKHQFGNDILAHLGNSAAIVRHPELQYDMVRLGIGLYGIDSSGEDQGSLQQISSLKTTIAQIIEVTSGDTVGYNRLGIIEEKKLIGTVRIGYADGYPRSLGYGHGKMWVNGHFCPVVGTVCMDMTMIDITGVPSVREGDEVLVFGDELPVQQLAHWANTIPYEIITGVSQRVKRVYFQG